MFFSSHSEHAPHSRPMKKTAWRPISTDGRPRIISTIRVA